MEKNAQGLEYAGFWRRLGSYLIDAVFWLIPVFFIERFFTGATLKTMTLGWDVVSIFAIIAYEVGLVAKLGGTPGRLLLKTKIRKLDGSPVTFHDAFLRYSVTLAFTLVYTGLSISQLSQLSAETFSLPLQERGQAMVALQPAWETYFGILLQAWVWSEFVVIMLNPKRRSIQDFIAGTVVLKDPPLTKTDADQEFVG